MLTEYKPFEFVQKFYIEETEGGIVLHYIDGAITYSIHIENDAYIPKSGLALCSWLAEICCGKSVLDVGTGQSCILARHAFYKGANTVDAVDCDKAVIAPHKIGDIPDLIKVFFSNCYSGVANKRYDVIVSNPPQLPFCEMASTVHDAAGFTGREVIEELIVLANQHLVVNGKLLLLVFGFLGVEYPTRLNQPTIIQLITENGLIVEKMERFVVKIRDGGRLDASRTYIERMYTNYHFICHNGCYYNEIYLIQCEKLEKNAE